MNSSKITFFKMNITTKDSENKGYVTAKRMATKKKEKKTKPTPQQNKINPHFFLFK